MSRLRTWYLKKMGNGYTPIKKDYRVLCPFLSFARFIRFIPGTTTFEMTLWT